MVVATKNTSHFTFHRVWNIDVHSAENSTSLTEMKTRNIVRTMKQNYTKHVYFSFFYPLRVTGGTRNRKFRMSSWGRTLWRRTRHGAKPVSFARFTGLWGCVENRFIRAKEHFQQERVPYLARAINCSLHSLRLSHYFILGIVQRRCLTLPCESTQPKNIFSA